MIISILWMILVYFFNGGALKTLGERTHNIVASLRSAIEKSYSESPAPHPARAPVAPHPAPAPAAIVLYIFTLSYERKKIQHAI